MIFPRCKSDLGICKRKIDRRGFLKLGILASVSSFYPFSTFAADHNFLSPKRSLSLYNTNTRERLRVIYWAQGRYFSEALDDINHILRDHYTGEINPIDIRLIDLLYVIYSKLEGRSPFYVISGYRSSATNAFLRRRKRGVAKNSLHMKGQAADIHLPGRPLSLLRRVAVNLGGGGVGYYPRSNFVHVDVGQVRYW